MMAVRRPSDGELCGHVREHTDEWQSLTVFGSALATHPAQHLAEEFVLGAGLPSLAERWWYRPDPTEG
jgi:hypothetical protein